MENLTAPGAQSIRMVFTYTDSCRMLSCEECTHLLIRAFLLDYCRSHRVENWTEPHYRECILDILLPPIHFTMNWDHYVLKNVKFNVQGALVEAGSYARYGKPDPSRPSKTATLF